MSLGAWKKAKINISQDCSQAPEVIRKKDYSPFQQKFLVICLLLLWNKREELELLQAWVWTRSEISFVLFGKQTLQKNIIRKPFFFFLVCQEIRHYGNDCSTIFGDGSQQCFPGNHKRNAQNTIALDRVLKGNEDTIIASFLFFFLPRIMVVFSYLKKWTNSNCNGGPCFWNQIRIEQKED